MQTTVLYILFAIIATVCNIAIQEIIWRVHPNLIISILFGTASGLACKYLLDKRYIFNFQTHNKQHGVTFILYSLTGVATTLIFWSFELGFDYLFQDKYMRYCGAIIGLSCGYYIKYRLDSAWVFKNSKLSSSA